MDWGLGPAGPGGPRTPDPGPGQSDDKSATLDSNTHVLPGMGGTAGGRGAGEAEGENRWSGRVEGLAVLITFRLCAREREGRRREGKGVERGAGLTEGGAWDVCVCPGCRFEEGGVPQVPGTVRREGGRPTAVFARFATLFLLRVLWCARFFRLTVSYGCVGVRVGVGVLRVWCV